MYCGGVEEKFVPITLYVNLATNVYFFFRQNEIQKVGLKSPPLQDFISCMNIMDSRQL